MKLGRRTSWFLLAFGVWSLVIWPTFLKNIWADPRSWNHGATGFFLVHLCLTIVSITAGIAIGLIGLRAVRAGRRAGSIEV
jgi:Na+/melibiose symporter-like transporter